jgi:hypothetical protein
MAKQVKDAGSVACQGTRATEDAEMRSAISPQPQPVLLPQDEQV